MPTDGNEVLLTEVEVEVLSVFVKRKQLNDKDIIKDLRVLINKLEK